VYWYIDQYWMFGLSDDLSQWINNQIKDCSTKYFVAAGAYVRAV